MRIHALAMAGVLLAQAASAPVEYRFAEVAGKVVLTHADTERRVSAGEVAEAGDEVRTGWRGRAVIEAPARASRFEVLPSTRVRLAGPEPGVLLVLERGRLKAIFDALAGHDDRLVATPGALLAVRGTRYGVEVEADGAAAVTVFEGTVEVLPRDAALAPLAVRAGEVCRFGPHTPPRAAPMPRDMREDSWRGGMVQRDPGTAAGAAPSGHSAPAGRPATSRPAGRSGRSGPGGSE